MELGNISSVVGNVDTNSDIGVAVLSKSLDTMNTEGNELVKLLESSNMERSIYPDLGGNIDVRI